MVEENKFEVGNRVRIRRDSEFAREGSGAQGYGSDFVVRLQGEKRGCAQHRKGAQCKHGA